MRFCGARAAFCCSQATLAAGSGVAGAPESDSVASISPEGDSGVLRRLWRRWWVVLVSRGDRHQDCLLALQDLCHSNQERLQGHLELYEPDLDLLLGRLSEATILMLHPRCGRTSGAGGAARDGGALQSCYRPLRAPLLRLLRQALTMRLGRGCETIDKRQSKGLCRKVYSPVA